MKINYDEIKEDTSPEAIEKNKKIAEEIMEEVGQGHCDECGGEGYLDIGGDDEIRNVRCPWCNQKVEIEAEMDDAS